MILRLISGMGRCMIRRGLRHKGYRDDRNANRSVAVGSHPRRGAAVRCRSITQRAAADMSNALFEGERPSIRRHCRRGGRVRSDSRLDCDDLTSA
jgi:hypothetical protein